MWCRRGRKSGAFKTYLAWFQVPVSGVREHLMSRALDINCQASLTGVLGEDSLNGRDDLDVPLPSGSGRAFPVRIWVAPDMVVVADGG